MNLFVRHHWVHLTPLKDLLFGSRPERLIAFSRLLFSCFALFAVYIDPTKPDSFVDEIYELLGVYIVYSSVLLYISSIRSINFTTQLLIHFVDIFVLTTAVYLTDILDSPFFTFYTFTVFTATMRWGWKGALSTAAVLAVLFIALSWDQIEFRFYRDSRMNILIMRGVYLFVTAAMLGYFGAYMDRSGKRLSRLAAWPIEDSVLGTTGPLRHASNVLGARLILVLWWDNATRSKRIAFWSPNANAISEVDTPSPWVAFIARQERARFFSLDAKRCDDWQPSQEDLAFPIDRHHENGSCELPSSYALAPFRSLHFSGCVVVIDPKYHSEDIVSLTEIVAVRIGADLERDALTREVAEAAIAQERVRVARDMHDSVLQDLTAASLMLKSTMAHVSHDLSGPLQEIGWLLASQQRRIRKFIEGTIDGVIVTPQLLSEQLHVLLATLERQWRCQLRAKIAPSDLSLVGEISTEIFQLICEATANAVRHGKATRLTVDITKVDTVLQVCIEDNGVGLATDEAGMVLVEPISIRKRVADMNGTLTCRSTIVGAQLSIRIPFQ